MPTARSTTKTALMHYISLRAFFNLPESDTASASSEDNDTDAPLFAAFALQSVWRFRLPNQLLRRQYLAPLDAWRDLTFENPKSSLDANASYFIEPNCTFKILVDIISFRVLHTSFSDIGGNVRVRFNLD